ncbi:DHA2 family efflux MFS transporter permease subunit [Filimonas effusa]|uniref:DHA2 family efflux MFS transporter permease subunit n=1 Tax=Filimonas effusa TaxID=2508721 RepID=A0A4V1MAC1_9BACT|nr:DHA2 family efflux MFS transporter permease subunit [Filimonas effusa]RXK85356.1 DHA2 family efflux MFS transporter permease subunit [Filimonas effusa]
MAAKGFAKFIIVLTTVTAAVMELIDTSIVNVALSDMAGSLGVSIEDISWVITSYAIANVIIIPLTGFLAEYFGRKRYYLASMIIFTLASYMCGESSSLMEIIIWRFVQGIGGGALLSTSQAILFDAFEPKDRPIASGLFGMGLVLGPTLGPTLGGYLIEHTSWPMIFMINVPIGVIATMLTYTFIEKKPNEGKNKKNIHIDYNGILLLAAGIGCLQFVLERGESEDWFSSDVIKVTAVVAVVALIGFIIYELRIKNPAVNLRVLGNRNLAFTTIFTFVVGLGLFTSVFVYPVLAQRVLGYTAYETGVALLPPTLIGVLMMPIIGKSMAKGVPAIPFVVVGLLLFAAYSWTTALLSPDVGKWAFFFPLALRAFGISMVQLPLINQAVAGLQPKDYPAGIALNNMIRQLGGAFGIALANNYIAHRYAQHRTDLVANVADGAPLFTERTNSIAQGLIGKTGADIQSATHTAHAMISGMIDKQAYYLSYLDTFRLIALFFVIVIPLVVFLKSKKKSAEEEAAAAAAISEAH